MKNKCYQGGKQHKYEPRYNEVPNTDLIKYGMNVKYCGSSSLRDFIYYKVYIYDICVWCGDIKKNG